MSLLFPLFTASNQNPHNHNICHKTETIKQQNCMTRAPENPHPTACAPGAQEIFFVTAANQNPHPPVCAQEIFLVAPASAPGAQEIFLVTAANGRQRSSTSRHPHSAPEIFPIEHVYAKRISRDGCCKLFVRCSGGLLRPNTEEGKQKLTRTAKPKVSCMV